MKYKSGFTLTEFLVSLIIGLVILITVVALSDVSHGSYNKLLRKAELYNDVGFGLSLLTRSIRNAVAVTPDNTANTIRTTNIPIITNPFQFDYTFSTAGQDFQYLDNTVIPTVTHTIFSGENNPTFDFRCEQDTDGNWIENSCTSSSNLYHITLSGERNNIAFSLSADAKRRN